MPYNTRRDFLKISILSLGALGLRPWSRVFVKPDFPHSERLGRIIAGKIDIKLRPESESKTVGVLYEDEIIPWLRDVTGSSPLRMNQRWAETPSGFVWTPYLQPVADNPNKPLEGSQLSIIALEFGLKSVSLMLRWS